MDNENVRGKIKSVVNDIIGLSPSLNIVLDSKGFNAEERRISGWASKQVVDRGGDYVHSHAFEKTIEKFKQNPVMLFMHNMREPIGTWDTFRLTEDGLWVSGRLVEGVARAEEAWNLAKQGALRALSIGFRVIVGNEEDDGFYHIHELELLEISPVTIPMNQDALFTVGKGGKLLDIKLLDANQEEAKEMEINKVKEDVNFFQLAIASHLEVVKHTIVTDILAQLDPTIQKIADAEKQLSDLISEVRNLSGIIETQEKTIKVQDEEIAELQKGVVQIIKGSITNSLNQVIALTATE